MASASWNWELGETFNTTISGKPRRLKASPYLWHRATPARRAAIKVEMRPSAGPIPLKTAFLSAGLHRLHLTPRLAELTSTGVLSLRQRDVHRRLTGAPRIRFLPAEATHRSE